VAPRRETTIPPKLRILFVTSMHPSGAFPLRGVIVQRLAAALRAQGHRVEVVGLSAGGGPWRYFRARPRVAHAIHDLRPDVIHVHFGYSGLALPRTTVPVVTTFNGDDLHGTLGKAGHPTWRSRLGTLASQYTAWRSARCIAVSATLRERLWGRGARAKTVVIRDAVDQTLFRPLSRSAARARLGLEEDALLVIFPHDVSQPTKRVWLAEAAVAELQRSLPATKLWIVNGKPPDEMPWYYAAADVMLMTSLREGGPSSVKEALACGIPVVSVEVGDTELFREAADGVRLAADEPVALAAALHDVLKAPRERRSLLPPGLDLGAAARAITALYREAIAT